MQSIFIEIPWMNSDGIKWDFFIKFPRVLIDQFENVFLVGIFVGMKVEEFRHGFHGFSRITNFTKQKNLLLKRLYTCIYFYFQIVFFWNNWARIFFIVGTIGIVSLVEINRPSVTFLNFQIDVATTTITFYS